MELRLPLGVVAAREQSLRRTHPAVRQMTFLALEAWPLRLATIAIFHDQPLFECSPARQDLEPALHLIAVASREAQSQQRRTVSPPLAMVRIAVAR